MKIAIDARMYGNSQCSGIGFYIQKLTENLFEIDRENEYIMFMREPEFSKFTPPNPRVRKVKVTPRWYTYGEQFILPFQFMKEKFDLIHYPHFNSPVFYRKNSVCTIHDITPLFFPGHKMKSIIRRLGYKAVFKSTLAKAKQIIAISQSTKNGIIKYFNINPDKISVIHEGVEKRFCNIQNSDIIYRTKQKFGISKPYIFFVGVWRNHKNIEGLIKAFNLLKKKHQIDHQLVLGGREDLHYTDVREAIENSPYKNDIITTGFISDDELPILYSAAEIFVIPSFIEGFGLIAIEAQSCHTPVVSSNTSSLPEIINDSGLFFDPKDSNQMAEQIYKVLNNTKLQKELVQKGIENVKRFDWKKTAEMTLEIYKKLETEN